MKLSTDNATPTSRRVSRRNDGIRTMPDFVLQYDLSYAHIKNSQQSSPSVYRAIANVRSSSDGGPDTSTLVGASTTQVAMESGFSSDSPTNDSKDTILSDNKESHKRRAEVTESLNSTVIVGTGMNKKKKASDEKVPSKIHPMIRNAGDACGKWENELESVRGLSESEACAVVNLVLEHLNNECFPDSTTCAKHDQKVIRLPQQGRVLMKSFDKLIKKYLQESSEQICRVGGVVFSLGGRTNTFVSTARLIGDWEIPIIII